MRPQNECEQAYYGEDGISISSPIHQRTDKTELEYAYFNTDYGQTSHSSHDYGQPLHCSHDVSFSFK